MSSVGIIFREPRQLSTLPDDWTPAPLGTRQKVSEVVDGVMQTAALGNLALTITLEDEGCGTSDACFYALSPQTPDTKVK